MTDKNSWVVHKFGGTSMGSVKSIRSVVEILESELKSQIAALKDKKIAVVVSAMSGVTDRLIKMCNLACEQNSNYESELEKLKSDHLSAAKELLSEKNHSLFYDIHSNDVKDLKEILRGVWLSRFLPETTLELVSGYGELWSSLILSLLWEINHPDVKWVDARKILTVENGETGPLLQWSACEEKMNEFLRNNSSNHLVITGFIASTPKGIPTTLKRNGSDFSASIFGRILKSKEIVIWTDVDGVYSADPRKVPEARCLKELSYEEAIELAYFGAKVIHPHTMGPAVELNIPILIKNTFNPSAPGTYIHRTQKKSNDSIIACGFTTIDQVSLINVEGTGMIGVPGVAQRIFGALREVQVSVILISQASSEHSICFAVPTSQSQKAISVLEKNFYAELEYGQIERIGNTTNCSILAMVGDNMVEKKGVTGRFFSSLGKAMVNVKAIAQGSSERNISVVIDQSDSLRALRASHSAFFLSDYTLSVGLVGPGLIGKTWIKQICEQKDFLKKNKKIDIRIRGVANSKNMWLSETGFSESLLTELKLMTDLKHMEDGLKKTSDLSLFADHIQSDGIPHTVIIDTSSSEEVASHYPQWLSRGIHVITPNKKAGSGDLLRYQKIRAEEDQKNIHFLYEATVGAGLPVISTMKDLIQTGDKIISIEGILSGTLSYLFSKLSGEHKFSKVLKEARSLGYTEPDPREDLNGLDVARKVVILAREAGFSLNLSDVDVESLVPVSLADLKTSEEFMKRVEELDAAMDLKIKNAENKNQVLRFVGSVDRNGQASVKLKEYSTSHPFARVQGTDNIIAFRTIRYDQQPLIIQGPGAGPEVTAGGVFADLLRLARNLGAST